MNRASEQRRLLAILIADVAGYSRLMTQDESRTIRELQACQRMLKDSIETHGGSVIDTAGDGVLAAFHSAVNSLECAISVQQELNRHNSPLPRDQQLRLRIGVHLGEVVEHQGRIFGDAVNVTARIAAEANPGEVLISQIALDQVRGKTHYHFDALGLLPLKNIEYPPHLFRVSDTSEGSSRQLSTRPVNVRQSIAVLPFANLSEDPDQEYFSDGISEDIITDLSKVRALQVVSRNTSFSFKGDSASTQSIARRLGVRYVLQGTVRKAGERIRVSTVLTEGDTDTNVWAERYDRTIHDIFDLQDELSAAIVAALKLKLLPDEQRAIEQRSTTSSEAYNLLLQARFYRYSNTIHDTRRALRLAQQAVRADPIYAEAWALIATSQIALREMAGDLETGLDAVEKALELDPGLAIAHAARGRVFCGLGRYEDAIRAHQQSERLDPQLYEVHFLMGRTYTEVGDSAQAIKHHEKAAGLAENEFIPLALVIQSYRALGRHADAMDASRRALKRIENRLSVRPDDTSALFHGASVLAELGDRRRAIDWADKALLLAPDESRGLYLLACTFALLGEVEQAVEFLDRALAGMHPSCVTWVKNDSDLDQIRSHPGYKQLIEQCEAALMQD